MQITAYKRVHQMIKKSKVPEEANTHYVKHYPSDMLHNIPLYITESNTGQWQVKFISQHRWGNSYVPRVELGKPHQNKNVL